MNSLTSAFTVVALGCCASAIHAQSQSSTPPTTAPADAPVTSDKLTRMSNWWHDDWHAGWEDGSTWRLMASPYTYHYTYNPAHTHVYMLGLERQRVDGLLLGGSLFRNSFGQPSAYAYVGQRFDRLMDVEHLFGQLTGGILYGYREPYNHKVPLNYKGWSPGAVLTAGWQLTPTWSGQVNFLGNSAVMFQLSVDLK